MPRRIAPHVARLDPYDPSRPVTERRRPPGGGPVALLASNENAYGPSPAAAAAITASLADTGRYPDSAGFELRQALSRHHGLPPESIVLGAGSSELIDLLARTFLSPGDEAVVSAGAFVQYRTSVIAAHGVCRTVPFGAGLGHDTRAMADAVGDATRLVFLANPNNPTGTYFDAGALDALLARVPPGVIVVLDEAYFEYVDAPGYPDGRTRLASHPGLVVLRTFSKAHGLAGLRVGYALADPEVASLLERLRAPFNTSGPAQAAALAALGDLAHVRLSAERNRAERDRLSRGLAGLGLPPHPSVANFLLVPVAPAGEGPGPPMRLYEALLARGVLVRPVAGFGFPECLRITVGTPEENDRCLQALPGALKESHGDAPHSFR
jgi:histidinol-phosphate aminotransferase